MRSELIAVLPALLPVEIAEVHAEKARAKTGYAKRFMVFSGERGDQKGSARMTAPMEPIIL